MSLEPISTQHSSSHHKDYTLQMSMCLGRPVPQSQHSSHWCLQYVIYAAVCPCVRVRFQQGLRCGQELNPYGQDGPLNNTWCHLQLDDRPFSGHSHCTKFDCSISEFSDILASAIQGSATGPAAQHRLLWQLLTFSQRILYPLLPDRTNFSYKTYPLKLSQYSSQHANAARGLTSPRPTLNHVTQSRCVTDSVLNFYSNSTALLSN